MSSEIVLREAHEQSLAAFTQKVRDLAKEHGITAGIVAVAADNPWDKRTSTLVEITLSTEEHNGMSYEKAAELGSVLANSTVCQKALKIYRAIKPPARKRTAKRK